jgi:hypothetical protein
LPVVEGIKEAYLGSLYFKEFKKLITDDQDNILSSVYYDNIRAFQGTNPVNRGIQETIEKRKYEQFVVLNNGITIVAKELVSVGNKFTISDYQIVNGCQTSHVLFNMRKQDGVGDLCIPLRLIVSSDENLTNEIIKATNSQTTVKSEELEAMTEFQKQLELYYQTYRDEARLYYERRSKQYNNNSSVNKTRIITIPIQIKSFAAMFLRQPHKVFGYYGSIKKQLGVKLFSSDHPPIVYYASAYSYYRLEQLFRSKIIDKKYKKCRYHLLMMVPYLVHRDSQTMPHLNDRKIEEYCKQINDILIDTKESKKLFIKAIRFIDNLDLDLTRVEDFKAQRTTSALQQAIFEDIRQLKIKKSRRRHMRRGGERVKS